MTDTDKWELQRMLQESQEELEKLWNHNKLLLEQLKAYEGQTYVPPKPSKPEDEADIGKQEELERLWNHNKLLVERLEAYEDLSGVPIPFKEEDEKLDTSKPTDREVKTKALKRLRTQFLDLHAEKMQLLEKLQDRDAELKKLREETIGDEPLANYPDVRRSLSVGEVRFSAEDTNAEVDRLRSVLEDKEKKLDNLAMQLKSFQAVASDNAQLIDQVDQLKAKLKASEVIM